MNRPAASGEAFDARRLKVDSPWSAGNNPGMDLTIWMI
jgi:hypothetical protein